jgi:hypothetical protein
VRHQAGIGIGNRDGHIGNRRAGRVGDRSENGRFLSQPEIGASGKTLDRLVLVFSQSRPPFPACAPLAVECGDRRYSGRLKA